jgi:hypothetical protein
MTWRFTTKVFSLLLPFCMIACTQQSNSKPSTSPNQGQQASKADQKGLAVSVVESKDHDAIVMLGNRQLWKELGTTDMPSAKHIATLPHEDVWLIECPTGGNLCEQLYKFVSVCDDNTVMVTESFGTCGEAQPVIKADSIEMHFKVDFKPEAIVCYSEGKAKVLQGADSLFWGFEKTPAEEQAKAAKATSQGLNSELSFNLGVLPGLSALLENPTKSGYEQLRDIPFLQEGFRKLLGDKLADFAQGLALPGEGSSPLVCNYYFASGCRPHDCGSEQAAICVDLSTGACYGASLIDNKPTLFGGAKVEDMPAPLREWLDSQQKANNASTANRTATSQPDSQQQPPPAVQEAQGEGFIATFTCTVLGRQVPLITAVRNSGIKVRTERGVKIYDAPTLAQSGNSNALKVPLTDHFAIEAYNSADDPIQLHLKIVDKTGAVRYEDVAAANGMINVSN